MFKFYFEEIFMTFLDDSLTIYNKKYAKKTSSYQKVFFVIFAILTLYIYSCLLFYSIFYQVQVIGQSMKPTFNSALEEGINGENSIYKDIVIVNRYETGSNGDIILIQKEDEVIIKRIIAKAGQTLTLKRDSSDTYYHFYLNGVKIDESYLGENYKDMNFVYYTKFRDNIYYTVTTEMKDGFEQATLVIPQNCVFALGDNRGNSSDSTVYGAFNISQIVGKVAFYYGYNQTLGGFLWEQFTSIFD
ncbi:MAG: signal peptidase I [Clostridia bacterium]|nr:signal peptidase I [Clostridia bacterium]